ADDDGVRLDEHGRVVGRLESAAGVQLRHAVVADVADVAVAFAQLGDLGSVDVEADDRIAAPGEGLGQRQADVAEADDGNAGGAGLQPLAELVGERVTFLASCEGAHGGLLSSRTLLSGSRIAPAVSWPPAAR